MGFFLVGQTRWHRPCRHEHGWQMAKMQSADQQTRHDLVAHAEHQCGVEHVMRQGHCRCHRNHVAAKQAELHARRTLRDAVTHGRYAARHLCGGALFAGLKLDQIRIASQRRVRREHVVVGGHDGNIGRLLDHNLEPVIARHACHRVGQIGATHAVSAGRARRRSGQASKVGTTRRLAARGNALGDACHLGVRGGVRAGHAGPRKWCRLIPRPIVTACHSLHSPQAVCASHAYRASRFQLTRRGTVGR